MDKTTLPKGVSAKRKKKAGTTKRKNPQKRESGAKGGRSKSPEKVAAARENGAKGGRPSEFDPSVIAKLDAFFGVEETRIVEKTIVNKKGEVVTLSEERGNRFPTFEGFCRENGVALTTLKRWAEDHPEVADALQRAKDDQARMIQVNALADHYPQPFAIFFMKHNHGWRDQVSVAHTGKDGGPIAHEHTTLDPDELERRRAATRKKMAQLAARGRA